MTSSVLMGSSPKKDIRSLSYYSHRYQKSNRRVQQRPPIKSEYHDKNYYLPSWFYVTHILEISRFWGTFYSITSDLHALGFVRSGTYIP